MPYRLVSVDVYPFNEHGEQLETGMKTFWHVHKGDKLLMCFDNKSEAEEYCQKLVEDDRWNAAIRR